MNTLKKLLSSVFAEACKEDLDNVEKKPWEHRLDIRMLFGLKPGLANFDDQAPDEKSEDPTSPDTEYSSPVGTASLSPAALKIQKPGSTEDVWQTILSKPTPFIQELRRQHFVECLSFFDRLRKALHSVAAKELEAKQLSSPSKKKEKKKEEEQHVEDEKDDKREDLSLASAPVTPKQVLEALRLADHNLSEDQKIIYLVRGFGQRLPDMHGRQSRSSIDQTPQQDSLLAAKDLMRKAAALEKGLKLLREHS